MLEKKNIKFVGKDSEPFAHINTARDTIYLPSAETQKKGFYHERAAEIIRLFPQYYKPLTPKG